MNIRIPEPEAMLDKEEIASFNQLSRKYLTKYGYHFVIQQLEEVGLTQGRVADFGTGSGWLSVELLLQVPVFKVTGIDLSAEMLEMAKKNVLSLLPPRAIFECLQADVKAIPLSDNYFDCALSFASMHHWDCSPLLVIQEACRLVKNGGWVIFGDLKRTDKSLLALKYISSKVMVKLFEDSIRASYTPEEISQLLSSFSLFSEWKIVGNAMSFAIVGKVKK